MGNMKMRSPVLGYNHNVRHAEWLWHVHTQDSRVQNPHIFTHLFHAGTILASKRLDYDPESEEETVRQLMQAQHKAMLRSLKAGEYDEKIKKSFAKQGGGTKAPDVKPVEKSAPQSK